MPLRDLVVVGGSAGAIEPLRTVVRGLTGFAGTVLVVIHVPPNAKSQLPELLTRIGTLPARRAEDGDHLAPGTVLVAPPDHHLLVADGHVRLNRGPRENGFRPAADALFRSAAQSCAARVTGVVLSGALDDGTMGLAALKAAGGLAVVQDPAEADFPGMPRSAIANVAVDAVLAARDIAPYLQSVVERDAIVRGGSVVERPGESSAKGSEEEELAERDGIHGRRATVLSCPECHGVLMRGGDMALLHFQCHTGHTYSPFALEHAQCDGVEETLGGAHRGLRERAVLLHMMAAVEAKRPDPARAALLRARARELEGRAREIRALLDAGLTAPVALDAPDDDDDGSSD